MSGEPAGGGYLHLLPTVMPQGMTVTGITASMLPWFAPAYSGFLGTTVGETPSPALSLSFEWPISWLRTTEPLKKFDREWLYLRRYSADQALATGGHAFSNVQPGGDPPDALVDTSEGKLGVESTSLTVEGRRGAHALFMELRQRLIEQDPVVFSKLAGNLVYVWFNADDVSELTLPHKRSEADAAQELLQELADYEPRVDQMWVPSGPIPQKAPEPPLASTPSGARFYSVPFVMSAPSTMLFTVAGFEVGLAYTTMLTAQTAWQEVQRLVDSHDKAGVDLLLISAGAPDQRGSVFPTEEAVADFVISNPLGLTRPPDHIRRVILHVWATGRATLLHPEVSPLFGPLYQSMVPLHHPLPPTPPSD